MQGSALLNILVKTWPCTTSIRMSIKAFVLGLCTVTLYLLKEAGLLHLRTESTKVWGILGLVKKIQLSWRIHSYRFIGSFSLALKSSCKSHSKWGLRNFVVLVITLSFGTKKLSFDDFSKTTWERQSQSQRKK